MASNNLTLTIELCAEDRARLDAILNALTGAPVKATAPKKDTTQPNTQAQPKEPTKAKPALEEPEQLNFLGDTLPWEEPKAQTAPAVKLEDIQALVVKLATSGKKAEAREIVKDYAERVTEIPAADYDNVYRRLKKLEA